MQFCSNPDPERERERETEGERGRETGRERGRERKGLTKTNIEKKRDRVREIWGVMEQRGKNSKDIYVERIWRDMEKRLG